jgi:hypothetical protein
MAFFATGTLGGVALAASVEQRVAGRLPPVFGNAQVALTASGKLTQVGANTLLDQGVLAWHRRVLRPQRPGQQQTYSHQQDNPVLIGR